MFSDPTEEPTDAAFEAATALGIYLDDAVITAMRQWQDATSDETRAINYAYFDAADTALTLHLIAHRRVLEIAPRWHAHYADIDARVAASLPAVAQRPALPRRDPVSEQGHDSAAETGGAFDDAPAWQRHAIASARRKRKMIDILNGVTRPPDPVAEADFDVAAVLGYAAEVEELGFALPGIDPASVADVSHGSDSATGSELS